MKIPELITYMQGKLLAAEYAVGDGAEARSAARWLAAYLCRCPLRDLPLYSQKELAIEAVAPYLDRLYQGEPLQYVLGETEFMGLKLSCTRAALIPRGDSERLVEAAVELLRDHAAPHIADVCCGGGAFGLALVFYLPRAWANACDISAEALALAKQNRDALGLQERVGFYQGDLLSALPKGERYDFIIANPPYIPSNQLAALPGLAFEPALALDGGPDGLRYYRRLAKEALLYLETGGRLLLEHGDDQGPAVRRVFEEQGFKTVQQYRDYGGRDRGVLVQPR